MKALYLSCLLASFMWFTAVPMGDLTKETNTLKEPAFAGLEEGAGSYKGTVKDEGTEVRFTDLSFFGHTTVGGIREEANDSMSKLDLANLKSLKVLQEKYSSKRYPEKDYCLVQKTTLSGTTEEVLVPSHIVICGIDAQTKDQRSWYLSKVDELIIEAAGTPEASGTAVAPAQEAGTPEASVTNLENKLNETPDVPKEFRAKKKRINVIEPITVKEKYREMEVKIVDKKADATENKSVIGAVSDVIQACINLIKTIFRFIKGLVW